MNMFIKFSITIKKIVFIFLLLIVISSILSAEQHVKADRIVIEKAKRKMILLHNNIVIREYEIALGRDPISKKSIKGDNKTPEGIYVIDKRNAKSLYHLSLHISYPDKEDLEVAKQNKIDPGGDIMIHGIRNGFGWIGRFHKLIDWTKGCIAVTNSEIEEIWNLAPNGTTVEIKP